MLKIYVYEKKGDVMFIVHENGTYFVFKTTISKMYINQQYELQHI